MGIGFAGVALAFGLTVVTMAYAVGHISGDQYLGEPGAQHGSGHLSGYLGATAAMGILASAARWRGDRWAGLSLLPTERRLSR